MTRATMVKNLASLFLKRVIGRKMYLVLSNVIIRSIINETQKLTILTFYDNYELTKKWP